MINPNIFRWFKIALKWEIIIISASFAFIMPWHPAHAATCTTSVPIIFVNGSIGDYCDSVGYRGGYGGATSNGLAYCETSGGTKACPPVGPGDGNYLISDPLLLESLGSDPRYTIVDTDNNILYENGQPVSPGGTAPDISSCTRSQFGFNTGAPGSEVFPDVINHRFRDADGCVYKADLSGSSAGGSSLDRCTAYPDSATPDDVWCYYNVVPDTTTVPPEDDGDDLPPDSVPSDTVTDSSSSSDIVVSPTETLPDGTTIDVTTKTTTTIDGTGFTIGTTTNEVIITNTDGTTTTETETTTVTTNPDGSYTVRVDTVTERVRPDGSRTTVSRVDGQIVSVDIVPGFTSRDDNYTEQNYAPDGSSTGGSSGGSSSGTGQVPGSGQGGGQGGDGDGLGAFCDWADIVCQLADWFLDEPLYPENPEIPFTEIDLSDVDGFDSGIGAGQCPADNVISTQFGAIPISWALPCQFAVTFKPIVLFFAWITALYIVVRVK